jgi:hypothetical protein
MRVLPFLLAAGLLCAQSRNDSEELVRIQKFTVQGTRFEPHSIQILTGLSPGVEINEAVVRKAIGRMMESGLVKSVDYNYESLKDPKSVVLELNIIDETPLLPATIEIPGVDAEQVWQYLASLDPLFTRELPRTQKALDFYIHGITDYLRTNKRKDVIVSIITGDATGEATGIIFKPAERRRPSRPSQQKN